MLVKKLLNRSNLLYLAFLQAWVATLGSLYFSEIRHFTPCTLCWYQRILMYPLILILAVAIVRKNTRDIAYYVLPMSLLGFILGTYHYLLQKTSLSESVPISCSAYGPCTEVQALFLGFITIPFLSLLAFAIISACMILILKITRK